MAEDLTQGFQECPCGAKVHWPMTPLELCEHGKHLREAKRERIAHRAYKKSHPGIDKEENKQKKSDDSKNGGDVLGN